jgi:hypothetical protein
MQVYCMLNFGLQTGVLTRLRYAPIASLLPRRLSAVNRPG